MKIQLEAVDFNPHPNAAASDGLSIRVDLTNPVQLWTPGGGVSQAAFAMQPTRGHDLAIEATFSFSGQPGSQPSAVVRARPVSGAGSVIGSVAPAEVPIPASGGANTTVSLPLADVTIWEAGVGRYEVSWNWQVQWAAKGPWTDVASTHHIVYVTLDRPNAPWTSDPATPQQFLWPWTTVLDWACTWAAGIGASADGLNLADARREAARRIEDAVNALGTRTSSPVAYGGAKFTDAQGRTFHLTEFVDLLHGLPPLPFHSMNCSDCAAAVMTFANVLGCSLTTHRVQKPKTTFNTNPIVPIGTAPTTESFAYHEFAVDEAGSDADLPVHDACLRVDFDAHPGLNPPADFRLPHGMKRGALGTAQPLAYIQRLIADTSGVKSAHVSLRSIDIPVGGAAPSDLLLESWRNMREQVEKLAGPPSGPVLPFVTRPFVLQGLEVYERKDNPWQLALLEEIRRSTQFLYASGSEHGNAQLLRVLVGFGDSPSLARDAFAWLLTQAHEALHVVPQLDPAPPRGVAFIASQETTAYVLRGQSIARITSEGAKPADLVAVLHQVDAGFRVAIQ